MSSIENFDEDARKIDTELERKGIALGIDWANEVQVRALARDALDHASENLKFATSHQEDHLALARVELFGLAALMLKTMQNSAEVGFLTHGGPAWKAFARALWAELDSRKQADDNSNASPR